MRPLRALFAPCIMLIVLFCASLSYAAENGEHVEQAPTHVDQFHLVALFDLALTGAGYSSGHGAVDAGWERSGLKHGARVYAGINTETVQLFYTDHALSDRLSFGVGLKGELLYAGLAPDYLVAGELQSERGFFSSYIQAAFELKLRAGEAHFIAWNTAVARNIFGRTGATADSLVLPADHWSLSPQLSYTYWAPGNDPSNWERHRLHPRTNGVALGGTLGVRVQSDARRWGTITDPDETEPTPTGALRGNNPDRLSPHASVWLRAGSNFDDSMFRVQGSLRAGAHANSDDISRTRTGGMNPYSVPIPGVAWAAFIADRYGQADLEGRVRVGAHHELGVLVGLAGVSDPLRRGRPNDWAAIPSVALVADLRPGEGAWQVDVRAAIAATNGWGATPLACGAYAALGRTF